MGLSVDGGGLSDFRLLPGQADAAAPIIREFPAQRHIAHNGLLVIRDQALFDAAQIDVQGLVALKEVGFDEADDALVADAGRAVAAELCHPRRQVYLLRVAEHVAVLPSAGEAAAQVGGIRRANVDRPFGALGELECHRQTPLAVQLVCGADADG